MPLQNDIQNLSSKFNSFVHKMSHVQKGMICIWRGIYLYATTFSMTLCFLILPPFLFTRNLSIDKNYTLNIFMLSGSIQFYSNFQFNMTCIYQKTMPFISSILVLSLSLAFTFKIIDHIKYASSHAFNLLKSLIMSKCVISHATNHLTQIMRFKHMPLRTYLVYKSHFYSSKFLISLVYTFHIHDRSRLVNLVIFIIR